MTSRVRIVFSDVDGTLIGKSGAIPQRVFDAAGKLRARGIPGALCSGRPALGTTLDDARKLGPDGFHVFQNGASVIQLPGMEATSRHFEQPAVERLIARARETQQFLELYSDTEYVFTGAERYAREHTHLLGIPFTQRPLSELTGPVVRAQWIVPHADAPALREELQREFPELETTASTSPLMPESHFVMLTLRGVNKASAVAAVCARLGIPLEAAMFVGDGDNDVAPMQRVGWPVAMGIASDAARAAGKHHVGDVEDGAAAEAFELALRD
jgi:Cof subfamily protein (haloacid dehalogenase superfamily)